MKKKLHLNPTPAPSAGVLRGQDAAVLLQSERKETVNILIVGGTHGDEPSGIELVRYFEKHPEPNIRTLMGNPEAVRQGTRFVESDLNRAFGCECPTTYEERRAREVAPIVQSARFVMDMHNAKCPNMSCLITVHDPEETHYRIARHFGLKRLLFMGKGGRSLVGRVSEGCIGVGMEISRQDTEVLSTEFLANQIAKLGKMPYENTEQSVRGYRRVEKDVSRTRLRDCGVNIQDLRNFELLTTEQKERMGLEVERSIAPIFVGETSYGPEFGCQLVELM